MSLQLNPIGYIQSTQIEPYQAARQPDENSEPAILRLNEKSQFEQALTNLEGCSHVWLIYHFHKNENWKPFVQTPRSENKIGVFATRAPYRPNPLGLTVVKLEKIEGLNIFLGPNDLLDGTPVFDIKPYHPESDLITDAKIEWMEDLLPQHKIQFSPMAENHLELLNDLGLSEISIFIGRQLEYDPTNSKKKRVEEKNGIWTLSYRTWRIDFVTTNENVVSVLGIYSGYTEEELASKEDPYSDKDLHRKFLKQSSC